MTNSGGQPSASGSGDLLARARAGDERAISRLFRRHGVALRKWARGRLPQWARSLNDTADIVQDALMQTFRRIDRFEDRGKGALQAYLRQAVMNRIRDEVRRVRRRPIEEGDDALFALSGDGPSPYDAVLSAEQEQKYKQALGALNDDEALLVVGRMELGLNYDQIALLTGRATTEAARIAVRRAVIKLAQRMSEL